MRKAPELAFRSPPSGIARFASLQAWSRIYGLPLFWLELFDHGANASVDGSCSHSIEDALTVFDDFVAQATRLELGGDGPKTLT